MLPTTYHIPAALILLAGGVLACFAGYRLFRLVLGIYGFILGALLAISAISPASLLSMAIVVLIGGVVGAILLLGGGLGVLVVQAIWAQQGWGDPRALTLFGCAIGGAIVALIFQRYAIVAGTAFGGAWTAVMGAAAMFGDPAAQHVTDARNVWIVYPFAPPLTRPWVTVAWIVLGIVGVIVQLRAGARRAK